MELGNKLKITYQSLTDREIVDKITNKDKHDEEAATYLLWDRYNSLLHKHFNNLIHLNPYEWYDYSVESLFVYLRGENGHWDKLSNFNWQSKFCYWFKKVSYNHFNDLRDKLIEKGIIFVSRDDDDPKNPKHEPVDDTHERNRRKVELLEAIRSLEDLDQKFVVMKRLEGYNSKEIAELMKIMWEKEGIKRTSLQNVRDENGNYLLDENGKKVKIVAPLVPTNQYVDVLMERAKKELKKIIVTID